MKRSISLRNEKVLEWSFLCPSAMLEPGQRTGKFRIGKDQLLTNANGESKISLADFAMAMIDELGESEAYPRTLYCGLLSSPVGQF